MPLFSSSFHSSFVPGSPVPFPTAPGSSFTQTAPGRRFPFTTPAAYVGAPNPVPPPGLDTAANRLFGKCCDCEGWGHLLQDCPKQVFRPGLSLSQLPAETRISVLIDSSSPAAREPYWPGARDVLDSNKAAEDYVMEGLPPANTLDDQRVSVPPVPDRSKVLGELIRRTHQSNSSSAAIPSPLGSPTPSMMSGIHPALTVGLIHASAPASVMSLGDSDSDDGYSVISNTIRAVRPFPTKAPIHPANPVVAGPGASNELEILKAKKNIGVILIPSGVETRQFSVRLRTAPQATYPVTRDTALLSATYRFYLLGWPLWLCLWVDAMGLPTCFGNIALLLYLRACAPPSTVNGRLGGEKEEPWLLTFLQQMAFHLRRRSFLVDFLALCSTRPNRVLLSGDAVKARRGFIPATHLFRGASLGDAAYGNYVEWFVRLGLTDTDVEMLIGWAHRAIWVCEAPAAAW